MAVKSTRKSTPKKKPSPPKKKAAPKKKPATSKRTNSRRPSSSTNKKPSTTDTKDKVSLQKKEEKPRDNFVNPLLNFDKEEPAAVEKGNTKEVSSVEKASDKKTETAGDKKPSENAQAKDKTGEEKPDELKAKGAEEGEKKSDQSKETEGDKKPGEQKAADADKAPDKKDAEEAAKEKEVDKAKEAAGTEKSKETSPLPEGVTGEQAQQVAQQIQDFTNLASHLPTLLNMGNEIKEGGIQAKHAEALEAAYGPLKGVLTPENIQAFKNMDLDQVDKLFSEQNMGILKSIAPELAEGLNSEKIQQLKDGLQSAQGMLDKNKLAKQMNMMSPFVDTANGEGVLSMVAGMVDDPNQLGGADGKLSMTDIGQVTHGLLNTSPVRGIVNGKINDGINKFVNYRQNGRRRTRLGQRVLRNITNKPKVRGKIYGEAWSQVRSRAPGEVRKQAAPYLGQNGAAQDRNIQRRFDDGQVQRLIDVGRQVQSMRGQNGSTGNSQIDNANSAMAGMTGILHKSVIGDDGAVSGQELRNVSNFGTKLYNYMGLLYHGLGGEFK